MTRLPVRPVAPILLLLGAVACSDALSPAAAPDVCGPGTVLNVIGGLEPVVSWTPTCRASAVTVEAPTHGITWRVVAAGNTLRPPIRYGEPPEHAAEFQTPGGPLVPGITYVVTLQRYRSATAQDTLATSIYQP
jgi:hypothetical protein